MCFTFPAPGVVELAGALDTKSSDRKTVRFELPRDDRINLRSRKLVSFDRHKLRVIVPLEQRKWTRPPQGDKEEFL